MTLEAWAGPPWLPPADKVTSQSRQSAALHNPQLRTAATMMVTVLMTTLVVGMRVMITMVTGAADIG